MVRSNSFPIYQGTRVMRLLYLLALLPAIQGQSWFSQDRPHRFPAEPSRPRRPSRETSIANPPEPSKCEDDYDICPEIALNNWCEVEGYKGKCCMSCQIAEETRDPTCHDKAEGCAYYKDDMCKPENYPQECRKTCKLCQPST